MPDFKSRRHAEDELPSSCAVIVPVDLTETILSLRSATALFRPGNRRLRPVDDPAVSGAPVYVMVSPAVQN